MSKALEYCSVQKEGRVTTVTIERAEVMNALHRPAHEELTRVFDAFSADGDAWVAVVTGAGERAFCAGSDLKYMAETGDGHIPEKGFAGLTNRLDLAKPVIAKVNGVAVGGGFEAVLACDLVVAADHARFGFPEPKVGLAAVGGGGLHRLARQIPLKQAMHLLLTGRIFLAEEAMTLGLVNQVVAPENLTAATNNLIASILSGAPLAVRATKQAAMDGLTLSLAEAMATRHPAIDVMAASADATEGPLAFAEKRPPAWSGT
ncbi:MAG: enoyl-CoA hydratase-related protein [Proteobacteria bacterium]|nr:enoyl-CoA hydratase-related protein [Pseudomonadota bacterium]MDA1308718.1 enoyl-CoA hydratase-related protein [Pseudomonadota bacterium]